jgi:hypothetical protein
MLTAGLLFGAGGVAWADPDASEDAGSTTAGDTTVSDSGNDSAGAADSSPPNDPPTSSVGNGREATTSERTAEREKRWAELREIAGPLFKHSIPIPVLAGPGVVSDRVTPCPTSSPCLTTAYVPVPTIDGALSYLKPEPEPDPSFRVQEEEPVLDAAGSGTGTAFVAEGEPPVLTAPPLIAAPPAAPPAVAVPVVRPPVAANAAASTPRAPGPRVGASASVAPLSRGSAPQAVESTPSSLGTSMSNLASRLGFHRLLQPVRIAELVLSALPGVVGLMLITASGGVLGYRRADAGRYLRADIDRFLP